MPLSSRICVVLGSSWLKATRYPFSGKVADSDLQYYVRRPAQSPVRLSESKSVVTKPSTTVHDEEPH